MKKATKLTSAAIRAHINVLVTNRDSADLMAKRGVDPVDVIRIGQLACLAVEAGLDKTTKGGT